MLDYEIVYIVSPEISDGDLNTVIDKVGSFAKKVDGSITDVTQWGRKKFTYPIKKFLEGNYVHARLEIEPKAVKELSANLEFDNEILRHLIIKL